MTFSNIRTTAFAVLITSCSAVSGSLLGATVPAATAPTITYTASGTFASPAANGNDTLKLAGELFSVTIAVSAATKPVKTGRNWALYTKLKLTGTVHSGLPHVPLDQHHQRRSQRSAIYRSGTARFVRDGRSSQGRRHQPHH